MPCTTTIGEEVLDGKPLLYIVVALLLWLVALLKPLNMHILEMLSTNRFEDRVGWHFEGFNR